MNLLSENLKFVKGIDPAADPFDSTQITDVVNLGKYNRCLFVVHKGVGATGTATFTIQASAASDGASPTAIPFKYRRVASGDTAGAITDATASGFTTTAGSSELYLVEVKSADLPDGKPWVHLKSVEVVNSPVLASVLVILGEPRYAGNTLPTAIV